MNNTKEHIILDLDNNQYEMSVLKTNIYAIHLWDILRTQKIDAYFATYYILNTCYQLTDEEETITLEDVLRLQPHITRDLLTKMLLHRDKNDLKNLIYTDPYCPNFGTFSNNQTLNKKRG